MKLLGLHVSPYSGIFNGGYYLGTYRCIRVYECSYMFVVAVLWLRVYRFKRMNGQITNDAPNNNQQGSG